MLFALLAPLTLVAACDKVPLLAPTGTVINLFPASLVVANNSQVQIVATVIEHGTASGSTGTSSTTSTGGTPVQNGTVVSFTTTIGHIEPADARTHNGQVTVTLFTDNNSGTPTITAYSGGASATNSNIKVGTATVKTITLVAQPATLGSSGGTTTVTATVVNDQGGPVPGVPVTFSTDNGSLSPSTVTTDASGNAATTLATTKTAKVTATSGTVTSGTTPLTVTVNPFALSGFSANPASASTGVPIVFTITPASGANISNVVVAFGDGRSQSLGSISTGGSTTVSPTTISHVYNSPGQYTASATVTDNAGGSGSLSTSVVIGSLPITLTASPAAPTVGSPVTFTVGGLGTAVIDHYVWTFDDGTPEQTTTSPQLGHTFTTRGLKNVRVDVFGVGGGQIGSAALQLDVQ